MTLKVTAISGALAAALLAAGQASAAPVVLDVTGSFTDYRFIGVGTPLSPPVSGSDPSTWPGDATSFALSGTVTVDGGLVTAATLNAGTISILYTGTGGTQPTQGGFDGLVYSYDGGTTLVQAPGTGAGVTGSCTPVDPNVVVNAGCTNALAALQAETSMRFNNWNGIPDGYVVSDLFGGSNVFNFPLAAQNGVSWTVGGTAAGDTIGAQLFRSEPNAAAAFNAAFAGRLELQVVPVPAAAWLLGSAIGLVGFMRRRAAA
jgi:hypothetical protein